jgi:CheY-like chemotaxis protein
MGREEKSIQIVLTDDDEDDRELFKEALSRADSKTSLTTFKDCESMVSGLLKGKSRELPRMIFLDINMPDKSGLQCLKELRKDAQYKRVPVIMFTTSGRLIDVQEARKFGANLFLNKPSDFTELKSLLNKLISPAGYQMLLGTQNP